MTESVRTPDERFVDLPDFRWAAHHVEVDGLRLARVDERGAADGPLSGETVVMLHGEPTWSYLWRHVAPPLLSAGARVVLPDLAGFGRSDKPTDRSWYTPTQMGESLAGHLDAIGLDEPFTLVVHDWGGLLGLTWAMANAHRVARLVVMDTALWAPGTRPSRAWQAFRDFVSTIEEFPIAMMIGGAVATPISDEVIAAYEAPFHEPAAHAGAIALPLAVPLDEDDDGAAAQWAAHQHLRESWDRPTLFLWGADDAVIPPRLGESWAADCPGSVGLEVFSPANHFLQEDVGEQLGHRIVAFLRG